MKTISSLQHLKDYGIEILTGEADNLGYRILMNVQLRGYKLLCEAYGLPRHEPLPHDGGSYKWEVQHAGRKYQQNHPPGWAEPMNDGVTCFLMQEHDLHMVAPIALATSGAHTVLCAMTKHSGMRPMEYRYSWAWHGLEGKERYWVEEEKVDDDWIYHQYVDLGHGPQFWPKVYGMIVRTIKPMNHPHCGTRNIHAFTGRSV